MSNDLGEFLERERAERARQQAWEAEKQRKIASTIPESELPCPRLELRWANGGSHGRRCDYNIVIPIHKYDIREDSPAHHGSELRFCMGWTTVSGGRDESPMYGEIIETPFRDGKHAQWDSHTTGFPAFVVWDGKAQSIEAEKPTGEAIPSPDGEHRFGDKRWAHRESTRVLVEAKNIIKRHAEKVRELRDQHPKGSWMWLYFNAMEDDLLGEANDIEDRGFTDFGDWVRFRTDKIEIEGTKRVCSECGAEVPDDVTEACEHVFGEDARAFMEESS